MNYQASPNFNKRASGCSLCYVVLHYTGMISSKEALDRLCDPKTEVSAHYLIDENGTLTQMVDEKLRAWHAGESMWLGQDDINSASIGIELSNPGHEFGYTDFTPPQLARLEKLLSEIFERYALPPSALLAHSDVAPNRKQDPGEKFPWKDFAAKGYGLWPDLTTPDCGLPLKVMLESIGYDCTDLEAAKTAFQRHYCAEELNTDKLDLTRQRLSGLYAIPSGRHLTLRKCLSQWGKSLYNLFINGPLKINDKR